MADETAHYAEKVGDTQQTISNFLLIISRTVCHVVLGEVYFTGKLKVAWNNTFKKR